MIAAEMHGAVEVLKPSAALNRETAAKLCESVIGRRVRGQPMVIVDLSQTPLIDSAGLEALLDVRDHVRGLGGAAKLAALSPLCRDILRATGVADVFEVYKDANAAVRSFLR